MPSNGLNYSINISLAPDFERTCCILLKNYVGIIRLPLDEKRRVFATHVKNSLLVVEPFDQKKALAW